MLVSPWKHKQVFLCLEILSRILLARTPLTPCKGGVATFRPSDSVKGWVHNIYTDLIDLTDKMCGFVICIFLFLYFSLALVVDASGFLSDYLWMSCCGRGGGGIDLYPEKNFDIKGTPKDLSDCYILFCIIIMNSCFFLSSLRYCATCLHLKEND